MLDFVLAAAHHLAVFTLVIVLGAELVLLRPGLETRRLPVLGRLDAAYGALAGLALVAGTLRVVFGAAGWDYYAGNWVFWLKMVLFAAVGLLSIPPTIAIISWRRAHKAEPGYVLVPAEVGRMQRFLIAELVLLLMIPVAAAAMARGIGL